ncbi:hypothetical protein V499_03820 [Pseudogymnoascus sp. VKM F-103]|nr:hypothetical protein V499_03820 [Pseudogymnoascus sp. VKM F-103]
MGGLVSANALVTRQNSPEKYIKSTVAAVRGMMFLGTPHGGSDKVKWANIGQKFLKFVANVNKDVTEVLEKDSVKLAQLGQFFPEFLRKRGEEKNSDGVESKIEVACFFEEHKTKPIGYVVEKESAKLAGYPLIGILADHTNMCRFAGLTDPGYVSVSGTLVRWVAEITSPKDQKGGGINPIQYGSTFQGGNYGGLNIGNANSFGGGSAVGGSHPIFGNQTFHVGRQE